MPDRWSRSRVISPENGALLEDYNEIEWARERLSANLRALGRDDEARAVYGPLPDF
jgi:hypothetical protein